MTLRGKLTAAWRRGRGPAAALLVACALFAGATAVQAQSQRPRIGLVLSGGGARGVAHVGVLKVLERLRIPIDAVAGTSMGAVVGGLFASGLSPDSMELVLEELDWADVFRDAPDRRHLAYRRKQDERLFPVGLELGFSETGLHLPPGLVSGQKLSTLLRMLTVPVTGIHDFDDLPIPFRAVATDIVSGDMVVMSEGDLTTALRASMAVPAVFTPYEREGRLLVDGGLVQNLPVSAVRAMGVDVVIAVDVGTPLAPREELGSVVQITNQVATILTNAGAAEQRQALQAGDVLITPDLGSLSATDFERSIEAVLVGEAAGREAAPALAALSVSPEAYHAWRAGLLAKRANPDTIRFIRFSNPSRVSPDVFLSQLHTRPGTLLDPELLQEDLTRLYGLGVYELVNFHLVEEDGFQGLTVDAKQKGWGPNFVRFRVAVTDNLEGGGQFNLATRVVMPQLNSRGGELRADLQIGNVRYLGIELFQPLDYRGHFFLAPYSRIEVFHQPLFQNRVHLAEYQNDLSVTGIDLGIGLSTWGEVRLGVASDALTSKPTIGPPGLPVVENLTRGRLTASLAVDMLDEPYFPRTGLAATVWWDGPRVDLAADTSYDRLFVNILKATTAGIHTLLSGMTYATSFGQDLPAYDRFAMGGLFQMSGYAYGEVQGNTMLGIRQIYYQHRGRFYLGGSIEAGNAWEGPEQFALKDLLLAGSVAVGMDTFLGPIYLGHGIGEGGRRETYLIIGQAL